MLCFNNKNNTLNSFPLSGKLFLLFSVQALSGAAFSSVDERNRTRPVNRDRWETAPDSARLCFRIRQCG